MVYAGLPLVHGFLIIMALAVSVRIFRQDDALGGVLRGDPERSGWGLDMMGIPLVVYSMRKILEASGKIERIILPAGLERIASALREDFRDSLPDAEVDKGGHGGEREVILPTDGLIHGGGAKDFTVERIVEPWDLLTASLRVLREDVTEKRIAPSAEVASTAVISGPCIISEGAKVDDFCKISGPVFIGPKTKLWTGSLVRESIIGPDCEVGFGCEVGRTYMVGADRVAHHDVILDSVLGWNTWMGAFIGTTNKLLNNAKVRYKKDGKLVDTGLLHFGAVFGHDSAIGAGTITLPGRFVPPQTIIQAGTVYSGHEETVG